MAQYDRPPKKKEKKVDEFISFFDHLVRYFAIHRYKLIAVLAVGVIAFAGYGIFLYWQNKRVEEFASVYADALSVPSSDALQRWQELEKMDPPLRLNEVVSIQLGGIYSGELKWEQAGEKYGEAADSPSPILEYLGQMAEAVALENSGSYQDAYEVYRQLSEEEGSPFRHAGKLGTARALGAMGKSDEAEAVLFQLIAKDSVAPQTVKLAAQNRLIVMKLRRDGE